MLLGVTVAVEPADKVPTVEISPAGLLHLYVLAPVVGAVGASPSVSVSTVEPKHNAGVDEVIPASTGCASTITLVVTCVLRQPVCVYVPVRLYIPL